MLGMKMAQRRRAREDGERPFWISFSDLMSALMVLFLVAMTVALLAVTNEISEAEREKTERDREIEELLAQIREATRDFPGVTVRGRTVDFGDRAHFDTNSHKLTKDQAHLLRAVIPKLLDVARDPLGQKWIKRAIVEGFADQRGTYLHNLNLSLQRSERVLCVLLAAPDVGEAALSQEDRLLIRELFLVGGSSFNSLKESLDESRRIELKLEFLDIDERRPVARDLPLAHDPRCPIDP
ncbi:flagellar motor protein MotB [Candidatus Accumulibacter sp. ACC003]|uniref:flagellar motor protein MotB n=1 Tax=Candidatus Accumulibacter sp. ACC003 TaxID=2823334 RepID=UPI0025BC0B6F|nr:flagellar motor protein MotB [Candidatus Accumulibacter sp. ACC003]